MRNILSSISTIKNFMGNAEVGILVMSIYITPYLMP